MFANIVIVWLGSTGSFEYRVTVLVNFPDLLEVSNSILKSPCSPGLSFLLDNSAAVHPQEVLTSLITKSFFPLFLKAIVTSTIFPSLTFPKSK